MSSVRIAFKLWKVNLFIEEERDDRSISNPFLRHINIFRM
jgi:hypothetical protein